MCVKEKGKRRVKWSAVAVKCIGRKYENKTTRRDNDDEQGVAFWTAEEAA